MITLSNWANELDSLAKGAWPVSRWVTGLRACHLRVCRHPALSSGPVKLTCHSTPHRWRLGLSWLKCLDWHAIQVGFQPAEAWQRCDAIRRIERYFKGMLLKYECLFFRLRQFFLPKYFTYILKRFIYFILKRPLFLLYLSLLGLYSELK